MAPRKGIKTLLIILRLILIILQVFSIQSDPTVVSISGEVGLDAFIYDFIAEQDLFILSARPEEASISIDFEEDQIQIKVDSGLSELSPILYELEAPLFNSNEKSAIIQYLIFAKVYLSGDCLASFLLAPQERDLVGVNCLIAKGGPVHLRGNLSYKAQINQVWADIDSDTIPSADIDSIQCEGCSEKDLILLEIKKAELEALRFDYTAGIQLLRALVNTYDEAYIYTELGNLYMLTYEWDKAFEAYSEGIALDARYAENYYRRGVLLYTMADREAALDDLTFYISLGEGQVFYDKAQTMIENIQKEIEALGQ